MLKRYFENSLKYLFSSNDKRKDIHNKYFKDLKYSITEAHSLRFFNSQDDLEFELEINRN